MSLSSSRDSFSSVVDDLRIVLLGKTGSGKSSTGNTILGLHRFKTKDLSLSSVTTSCKKELGQFDERTISVIDTPGIFDTSMEESALQNEIERCIALSLPGPHIFLLVVRLDVRFTVEEKNAIEWIKKHFGEESNKYTMVVFTRGDELKGKRVETILAGNPELKKLLDDCKAGYTVFDNTCMKNRTQVADLLESIDKTVQLNGNYYTNNIYEEVQQKRKRDEWWGMCANAMHTASRHLGTAAIVAAAPAVGGAVAAEELVLPSVWSLVMAAGSGAANIIGRYVRPKPKDSDDHQAGD